MDNDNRWDVTRQATNVAGALFQVAVTTTAGVEI